MDIFILAMLKLTIKHGTFSPGTTRDRITSVIAVISDMVLMNSREEANG